jgi:hypothetical protein
MSCVLENREMNISPERYKTELQPQLPEMAVNREGLGLQAMTSRAREVQFGQNVSQ